MRIVRFKNLVAILNQSPTRDPLGLEIQRVNVHQIVLFDVKLDTQENGCKQAYLGHRDTVKETESEHTDPNTSLIRDIKVPLLKSRFAVVSTGLIEAHEYVIRLHKKRLRQETQKHHLEVYSCRQALSRFESVKNRQVPRFIFEVICENKTGEKGSQKWSNYHVEGQHEAVLGNVTLFLR